MEYKRLTERVKFGGVRYEDRDDIYTTCYPDSEENDPIDKLAIRLCELEDMIEKEDLVSKEWHNAQVLNAEGVIAKQKAEIERLKERNYWLASEHEYQCEKSYFEGVEKGREQAVKDTAREIWEKAKHFYRQYPLSTEVGFCCFRDWIKERYGVEVE